MRKRAECAMCRGMRITTDNCHARKRCALFRTNNVNDTLTVGMPHKYVESTLLPFARFFATRSHFFFEKDKLGQISGDVARASALIGVANPDAGTDKADQVAITA